MSNSTVDLGSWFHGWLACVVATCTLSCGHAGTSSPSTGSIDALDDHFESAHEFALNWSTDAARDPGVAIELGEGMSGRGVTLSVAEGGSSGGVVLRRRIDTASLRGTRVKVHVHARVGGTGAAHARLELTAESPGSTPGYQDVTRSRDSAALEWLPLGVVADIGPETTSLLISLILDGTGTASFDDLVIEQI
ncbi:MAG: hypothetical protein H0V89_14815, partial [Deltaproteobacteria bacterium]|nr:hypothetical protein [Deltaproteobacteria bacterium]